MQPCSEMTVWRNWLVSLYLLTARYDDTWYIFCFTLKRLCRLTVLVSIAATKDYSTEAGTFWLYRLTLNCNRGKQVVPSCLSHFCFDAKACEAVAEHMYSNLLIDPCRATKCSWSCERVFKNVCHCCSVEWRESKPAVPAALINICALREETSWRTLWHLAVKKAVISLRRWWRPKTELKVE